MRYEHTTDSIQDALDMLTALDGHDAVDTVTIEGDVTDPNTMSLIMDLVSPDATESSEEPTEYRRTDEPEQTEDEPEQADDAEEQVEDEFTVNYGDRKAMFLDFVDEMDGGWFSCYDVADYAPDLDPDSLKGRKDAATIISNGLNNEWVELERDSTGKPYLYREPHLLVHERVYAALNRLSDAGLNPINISRIANDAAVSRDKTRTILENSTKMAVELGDGKWDLTDTGRSYVADMIQDAVPDRERLIP